MSNTTKSKDEQIELLDMEIVQQEAEIARIKDRIIKEKRERLEKLKTEKLKAEKMLLCRQDFQQACVSNSSGVCMSSPSTGASKSSIVDDSVSEDDDVIYIEPEENAGLSPVTHGSVGKVTSGLKPIMAPTDISGTEKKGELIIPVAVPVVEESPRNDDVERNGDKRRVASMAKGKLVIGPVTFFDNNWHILQNGSLKSTDSLHDPEGHRYCCFTSVNKRGSGRKKPGKNEVVWRCTSVDDKRVTCNARVSEDNGGFTVIRPHKNFPHPKPSSIKRCPVCVDFLGLSC